MERTKIDFVLFTDGSGREADGFGGYAALVKTFDGLVQRFVMGAISETSVDRAEFTALIEGLRITLELWKSFPGVYDYPLSDNPVLKKPTVHWYSDRESLVLSVKKVYGRGNCEDLWAAFEWFETKMHIIATHIVNPDETPEFVECDAQASQARIVMKNYYASVPLAVDATLLKQKTTKKEKHAEVQSEKA